MKTACGGEYFPRISLRGIVSRLSGRKEHIVVDTLRLPVSVRVIRLMFMTVSERKRCSNP